MGGRGHGQIVTVCRYTEKAKDKSPGRDSRSPAKKDGSPPPRND